MQAIEKKAMRGLGVQYVAGLLLSGWVVLLGGMQTSFGAVVSADSDRGSVGMSAALDDLASPEEIEADGHFSYNPFDSARDEPVEGQYLFRDDLTHESMRLEDGEQFKDQSRFVLVVNKALQGTHPLAQTITIYERGQMQVRWPVSTGRETPEIARSGRRYVSTTPVGVFRPWDFSRRHWSETWHAWMDFSIFFMGGVAIHATTPDHYAELGARASGGCVRLERTHAQNLFESIKRSGRQMVRRVNRDGSWRVNSNGVALFESNYDVLIVVVEPF